MSAPAQRGGSTLAAVMLLLVMGLMLLNAQHRQLDQALLLASDQRRYLLAYNQAASALSWGMAQASALAPASGFPPGRASCWYAARGKCAAASR
ncbi:Protein of uncharacterised function (DUF2509) [Serratia ficaria]|nr:Protein of uncharacterised function (DUF2509) [Serratia ficaria]